jgi:hypothetical protein
MSTIPSNTYRDIAVTEYEVGLLRQLLAHLEITGTTDYSERMALAQVIDRWDANDATEFTFEDVS